MKGNEFVLVLITPPHSIENEAEVLNRLLSEERLTHLHIRKPDWSEAQVETLLKEIPTQYYPNIRIHGFSNLATKYNLGGIHLNSQQETRPNYYNGNVSYSCHSIAQLVKNKVSKEYVFLSPIFDSISKTGYSSAFEKGEIESAIKKGYIDSKVYALGGVSLKNISQIKAWKFGGAAVLGALWNTYKTWSDLPELLSTWKLLKVEADK